MRFMITMTASLLLAGTTGVLAQQSMYEGQKNKLDANNNGAVNRQEYQAFMTEAFEKLDADNNDSLSQAETSNILSADQFSSADANGDGRISQGEFTDRVMKDFDAADKSGDGRLQ